MPKKEEPKKIKDSRLTIHGESRSWLALFQLNRRQGTKGPGKR